jgi:hypothetical protein
MNPTNSTGPSGPVNIPTHFGGSGYTGPYVLYRGGTGYTGPIGIVNLLNTNYTGSTGPCR